MHIFTEAQAVFIRQNMKKTGNVELTQLFNSCFKLNLKLSQIKAFKKNHRLNSGLDGRFRPGNVPFNKGIKGLGGWEPTEFKKGYKPHNYLPVGSERINTDGYIETKIADPNKWKGNHILVWVGHNGNLPSGYCVIFGD
jgi:hypothetical protein